MARMGKLPVNETFYYVYVLVSLAEPARHYTGLTENLRQRLAEHNAGKCLHSSKFVPWRVETAVAFRDKGKAAAFERYLKSGSGRAFAVRHF
jgi:predicted GIY-YIG superfamily endonuclease